MGVTKYDQSKSKTPVFRMIPFAGVACRQRSRLYRLTVQNEGTALFYKILQTVQSRTVFQSHQYIGSRAYYKLSAFAQKRRKARRREGDKCFFIGFFLGYRIYQRTISCNAPARRACLQRSAVVISRSVDVDGDAYPYFLYIQHLSKVDMTDECRVCGKVDHGSPPR